MSSPVESAPAWEQEFQARFGIAPGNGDPVERQRLVQLCQELLAERECLRAEVARLQLDHDRYYHAFGALMKKELAKLAVSRESLAAGSAPGPSLQEVLAELERDEGK